MLFSLDWGNVFIGRGEVPFSPHFIKGSHCQYDLSWLILTSVTCLQVVIIRKLPTSSSILYSLKASHNVQCTLKDRRVRWSYLEILCTGYICIFFLIYLVVQSFIYISRKFIDIHLTLWVMIQYLFIHSFIHSFKLFLLSPLKLLGLPPASIWHSSRISSSYSQFCHMTNESQEWVPSQI